MVRIELDSLGTALCFCSAGNAPAPEAGDRTPAVGSGGTSCW